MQQVSEATRRLLGKEWEVEPARSVGHAPWEETPAYTIRRGSRGMRALVEATGGEAGAVARFLLASALTRRAEGLLGC
jgi:hypothetical protein